MKKMKSIAKIIIAPIKNLWINKWMLRYLLHTIYFNFHYLPFWQAVYLPIWLYKPHFVSCKGKIKLDVESPSEIRSGMIKLGCYEVHIFPNNGIIWENNGLVIFKGGAHIGNNSAICSSKNGIISFGSQFAATSSFKLVCFNNVYFGDHCLFGWDCLVLDTDFHVLSKIDGSKTKGFGKIVIGNNNWFANGVKILKNTVTPDDIVIASNTLLTKSYLNLPSKSVIGVKREVEVLVENHFRDHNSDHVDYCL